MTSEIIYITTDSHDLTNCTDGFFQQTKHIRAEHHHDRILIAASTLVALNIEFGSSISTWHPGVSSSTSASRCLKTGLGAKRPQREVGLSTSTDLRDSIIGMESLGIGDTCFSLRGSIPQRRSGKLRTALIRVSI